MTQSAEYLVLPHASRRMEQMCIKLDEVLKATRQPQITYPSVSGADGQSRRIHVRDRLAVIVACEEAAVVTVLWNGRDGR